MKTAGGTPERRKCRKTCRDNGLKVHLSQGAEVTIIGVIGDKTVLMDKNIELMKDVDKIIPVTEAISLQALNSIPSRRASK